MKKFFFAAFSILVVNTIGYCAYLAVHDIDNNKATEAMGMVVILTAITLGWIWLGDMLIRRHR